MYNSIFSAHVHLFLQLMEPHAMFGNRNKIFNIEKNTQFVDRVLFLSLPSALVFIMLVALRLITPTGDYILCDHHFLQYRLSVSDYF